MENSPNKFNALQATAVVASMGALALGVAEQSNSANAEQHTPPNTSTELGATALAAENSLSPPTAEAPIASSTEETPKAVHMTPQKTTGKQHIHKSIHPPYSRTRLRWLQSLRICESSDNYKINTGNGFYGAYQFTRATWNSLHTGYAYAHQAPPRVQDKAIIRNTLRSAGGISTQNPGCYQKLGLSKFPPR